MEVVVEAQTLAPRTASTRRWSSDTLPPLRPRYPIVLLRPPYEERDLRSALPDLGTAAAQPGSVIGVQISRPSVDPGALRELVVDLSKRAACPVVVLLQMSAEDGVLMAARLAPLRFRAVAPLGPGMQAILRDSLTDASMLAQNVIEWLQLRSIRLNPRQVHLVETIFAAAPRHEDLTALLDHHRIPQSSARFRLKKRGLPSPTRWFQLARAIHAALRLQARPDLSVATVARQLGFADHSALAHLLRRSLHVTANEIRGTLGWEWLLERWLRSSRIPVR